ncbi:MAG: hypothetical protein NZ929_05160 [Aigarchaeota archaeon]|nr:hypothetical protein [Aigarchaeota archaeon]MDW7985609.1 hypothetical protein [Nitrososphaerota archaeon]
MSKRHIVLRSEIYARIIEILQKTGGKTLEENLLEELKKKGIEITLTNLRSILMKLEIHDKIRVFSLDEDKKLIELVQKS